MDSRVYYGEYSLKHWMKMMLSKNIILPEYQRSFVWEEKDVRRLVDSIQHGQFVQPVTIALYKVDEGMPVEAMPLLKVRVESLEVRVGGQFKEFKSSKSSRDRAFAQWAGGGLEYSGWSVAYGEGFGVWFRDSGNEGGGV